MSKPDDKKPEAEAEAPKDSRPERSPGLGELPATRRWATLAIAACAAGAVLAHFGIGSRGLISAGFAAVLVVLASIDLEYRVIPNRNVLPATGALLVLQIAFFPDQAVEWIVSGSVAGLVMLLPALVRPGSIGLGDVKLSLLLGVGLGWDVVSGLLLGSLAAVPVALWILFREGLEARKQTIPLGPFLAFGGIVAMLAVDSL